MDLERTQRLYDRGRARWPGLALRFEDFVEQVRPRLAKLPDVPEEKICAEDLFLVAACLQRLPGAVDQFDAFAWPHLAKQLQQMESSADQVQEMRQVLLVRLFVPDSADGAARISGYTGRGPLVVWLRMVAARLSLTARRNAPRSRSFSESDADRAGLGSDVELGFIRGRYESDFAEALREAMTGLSDENRFLLRLRYRDELSSSQIGKMFKVSRVTAHRRVVEAREQLADQVREQLRARLSLTDSGLAALLSLLSSRLVPALTAELRAGLS